MSEAREYGRLYWCVKVPKEISKSGEIYLFADDVRVREDGSLEFEHRWETKDLTPRSFVRPNLILAPGQWIAVYAASCLDGHAVAVVHWKGEVESER